MSEIVDGELERLGLHSEHALSSLFEGTLSISVGIIGKDRVDGSTMDLLEDSTQVGIDVTSDMHKELGHDLEHALHGVVLEAGALLERELLEQRASDGDGLERGGREVVEVVEFEVLEVGARLGDAANGKVVELDALGEVEVLEEGKVAGLDRKSVV